MPEDKPEIELRPGRFPLKEIVEEEKKVQEKHGMRNPRLVAITLTFQDDNNIEGDYSIKAEGYDD